MMDDLTRIKQLRQKLGLTQIQLAQLANVSQSMIAKIERGVIEPSYSIARRIILALEKKAATLQEKTTAKDICSDRIIAVKFDDKISKAIELMQKYDISQMPVFRGNLIVGSVSEDTFIRKYNTINKRKEIRVGEIMDNPYPTIPEDTPLHLVKEILKTYPAVIVIRNGEPVGIISKADLLKQL